MERTRLSAAFLPMYTPSDFDSVWSAIRQELADSEAISDSALAFWFRDIRVVYADEESVVFSIDKDLKRSSILNNYAEPLANAVAAVTGCQSFEIIVEKRSDSIFDDDTISPLKRSQIIRERQDKAADELRRERLEEQKPIPDQTAREKNESAGRERRLTYNSEYTFDNFIVGESNRFAHSAAKAVANNPASTYNPLLFYGPPGLGKTHLMYAITNKLFERSPDLNAIYINGEDFTNQLIEAIGRQKNVEFREKYRKADVLLIDDIQFIAGKESTQEEFFHTFNALYQDHKQIILTSDRPPKDMVTLEARIRTRLEQGLMADIQEPDYELRLAILKKKAESMGLSIDDEILSYIAEKLQSNIRQLEGIVRRISATHLLDGADITMDLVRQLVPMFQQETESTDVTVEKILTAVQKRHDVSREDILGMSRVRPIATARNIAMYLIRQVLGLSNKSIGDIFGNRDHSTVVSNLRAAETLIKNDPLMEAEVRDIRREIRR